MGHSAAMPSHERSSGTGLLVLMSGATVLATAIIAVSMAQESWLLLPVALLSVAAGAVCVLIAIARSLADDGEDAEETPAAAARPAPAHAARHRSRYAPERSTARR
jgi:hypothetical protein